MKEKQTPFEQREMKKRIMFMEAMNRLLCNRSAVFGLVILRKLSVRKAIMHRIFRTRFASHLKIIFWEQIIWEEACWPVFFMEAEIPF